MKKAIKPAEETSRDFSLSDKELEHVVTLLDTGNQAALKLKKSIKDRKNYIKQNERHIETYKASLTQYEDANAAYQKHITNAEASLAALPPSNFTIDTARETLEKIKALPWIASLNLTGSWLSITTTPGALKTTFYQGIAYFNGQRTDELLEEPIVLPLPTYTIEVNLENLSNQSSWTRNPDVLRMGLAIRGEFNSFVKGMGWNHEPHAHWATNESGRTLGTLGDVCLGDYATSLQATSKRGLFEFLNELAIYLQTSGWSSAYRPKLTWACYLGNPTFNRYLIHEMTSNEEVVTITASNRARLPEFLKEHGLSMHQYLYGAANDSEEEETHDIREFLDVTIAGSF